MSTSLELIAGALDFAARCHRDQRRKDVVGTPYINHPIALLNVLVREGGVSNPVVLCAALLHDVVEDTSTTQTEITRLFGTEVAAVVKEVTDDKHLSRAERKRSQVARAQSLSSAARLVKLADKICNLRDLHCTPPANWDKQRRREYFDWCRSVINELRGSHVILEAVFDQAYSMRP